MKNQRQKEKMEASECGAGCSRTPAVRALEALSQTNGEDVQLLVAMAMCAATVDLRLGSNNCNFKSKPHEVLIRPAQYEEHMLCIKHCEIYFYGLCHSKI